MHSRAVKDTKWNKIHKRSNKAVEGKCFLCVQDACEGISKYAVDFSSVASSLQQPMEAGL